MSRFTDRFIDKREVDRLRDQLAAQRRDIESRRAALDEDLRRLVAQEEILGRLQETQATETTDTASANANGNGKHPVPRRSTPPRPPHPTRKNPGTPRPAASPRQASGGAGHVVQKGETTKIVFETVRERPGLTSAEIATALERRINSGAISTRKLVHSTLGYLRDRTGKVRKDEQGRYFANEGAEEAD